MTRLVAPAFLFAVPYIVGIAAARRLEAKRASFIGIAEVFLVVPYEWPLLGQLPSAMQFTGGAFLLVGWILFLVISAGEHVEPPRKPLHRS